MKTLIIAEVGVNHNGDMAIAREMIDVAVASGADIVKFQTYDVDQLVTDAASRAPYQYGDDGNDQRSLLKKLKLSHEMHYELFSYCASRGISFLSTAFDIGSLKFLMELGIDYIKIPSGEITNLPFLRFIGSLGKPIIMSTGASTLNEVASALGVLKLAGASNADVTVLHCNSAYPTPVEDVNLRAMISMGEKFNTKIGYSDHTLGIEVPFAAVALGASVIEKHFTLSRELPGPDQRSSLEPNELSTMVAGIRNIELALGDGIKRPTSSEQDNISPIRKSLVAKYFIAAGQEFTIDNIAAKRPGHGISPMMLDVVVGKVASHDFFPDEMIEL